MTWLPGVATNITPLLTIGGASCPFATPVFSTAQAGSRTNVKWKRGGWKGHAAAGCNGNATTIRQGQGTTIDRTASNRVISRNGWEIIPPNQVPRKPQEAMRYYVQACPPRMARRTRFLMKVILGLDYPLGEVCYDGSITGRSSRSRAGGRGCGGRRSGAASLQVRTWARTGPSPP